MVLQRRFFTIQRIPILRYGYRDRFPLIDILQIPVAQLDVYEPVWEINGITFRRKIRIGILHFRFKSDAKVRHFLKSANIYRIIFQTFYIQLREVTDYQPANYNYFFQSLRRITRAGFPTAILSSGISFVTTLPAPITQRSPIVTPGHIIAPPPIQQSSPTATG